MNSDFRKTKPPSIPIKIFALSVFFILQASCSDKPSSESFRVQQPETADLKAQLDNALPRLLKACPGLNTHSVDFSPASISTAHMRDYDGGIELTFKISEVPRTLPPPLNKYSSGNTCYISISSDASKAYIGKQACHSICDGSWQENTSDLMGREFSLLMK